jgi:hypothetical protein
MATNPPAAIPTPGGGGGGGTGGILATAEYLGPATYLLTGTMAVIDAVNATLAFDVPANGIVDVDVDIAVTLLNSTPFIVEGAIGLLDHTSGLQVGSLKSVGSVFGFTGQYTQLSIHNRFHLTGMTPGACLLDLAGVKADNGGTSIVQINVGTSGLDASPILMQASASV